MFQVPGGGGYNMQYSEVMKLSSEWKNYLLIKYEENFEKAQEIAEEEAGKH